VVLQQELARLRPATWRLDPNRHVGAAGTFVAGPVGLVGSGAAGESLWAAAVALVVGEPRPLSSDAMHGRAGGPYTPGLLALREGELLERTIRSLRVSPDVVLVNGTGRDHPRRAGIALHLGAVLDVPTVGVTVRPLVAEPVEPGPERGSTAPLVLEGEVVGAALRTRRDARPVLVHAAWRTDATIALDVVRRSVGRYRTPEPIRLARRLAREARAR
jgi:deoxyribonuclease V